LQADTPESLESIRFRSVSFAKNVPRHMRAIAFRRKELHEERDDLNAYAVYKTRDDAISAGKRVNGVVFSGKHLRADLADGSVRVCDEKVPLIIPEIA
jgi:nucleolar protein 12